MKTAEELLREHTYYKPRALFTDGVLAAMKEYAEQAIRELEKRIKELEAENYAVYEGADQWRQEYDDCLSILQKLVDLKVIKDTDGKTPYYLENQPLAWEQAKEFLKKYQHQIS